MEEVLANIGSEMTASTDWSEVMTIEETMAQKERIVKGDNEWSGDNMWVRSDRAGCRVITTNAAKRVLTQIDTERLEGGKVKTRTYLDYLINYMQEMQGDIMVIHEPGLIYSASDLIKAAATAQGLSAVVASTQGSKAAGAVVLLGAQWAKVYTAHQAWVDSRGEQRLVTMEFKAKR